MMQTADHVLIELYEQRARALRSEADNDRLAAAVRSGSSRRHDRFVRRRRFGWLRP